MSDDYRQRMLAIADELRQQGVGRYTSAPPIYRLAWLLGLRVRPPLYQSSIVLVLENAVWFAVVWGPLTWLSLWRGEGKSITFMFVSSVVAGTFFGLMMTAYYQRKASRLRLPPLDVQPPAA